MDGKKMIELVKSAVDARTEEICQGSEQKKELLAALRKLTAKLEDPNEAIVRMIFQPHENAVIRIAIDLNLFVLVGKEESGLTAEDLQALTGAEDALLVRIMRLLTAMGVFTQTSEQRYVATPISKAWTAPPVEGATRHLFDEAAFSLSQLPVYLQQTEYRNPVNTTNSPFQHAFQTNLKMWEYISERPPRLNAFNTFMEGQREGRIPWFHHFPVQDSLGDVSKDTDAVLIVDVGGGRGHDMEAFKSAFPQQQGKLILQDLPMTIEDISHLKPGIEAMKHNFFTPQPVKGAKAYYFRNIFHDWPDSEARVILQHAADAMKKGYSRLLINEWVLSDTNSSLLAAMMDINMMCLFAGTERTRSQWDALLGSAGLKIVKLWGPGQETESLIEAVLE
ncbi:MAG: hypothetical protein LQ343_002926 [Gyalolechia ehrenbergii]|nr:MAG: hypothetical protein LQ343_002926 [Gyalolechia ehrenbergii]